MRQSQLPVSTWTKRCEDWLRAQKIIPAGREGPASKPDAPAR
jgi:hypothetical protein